MKLAWSERALSELLEALSYLQLDNPDAAARLAARMASRCDQLRAFPHLGRRRSSDSYQLTVPGTRYSIVYTVIEDRVVVARVIHGARNPDEE